MIADNHTVIDAIRREAVPFTTPDLRRRGCDWNLFARCYRLEPMQALLFQNAD